MKLLNPNMFKRPEEPKESDYTEFDEIPPLNGSEFEKARDRFQKDHENWKFITGPKPEPDVDCLPQEHIYSPRYQPPEDKSTYDKTLKEWQDNQIIFEGWRHEKSSYDNFIKGDLVLTFVDNGIILCGKGEDKIIYNGPCDVDLFEKLLEIRHQEKN